MNDLSNKFKISRRSFIKSTAAVGGGILISFHIPMSKDVFASSNIEINAWLTIDPDGIVTVRTPQTEMGQGSFTSIPMMIAEELDVPWENIRASFADANRHLREDKIYKTTSTGGSRTVRSRHPYIMQAGASARERLKQAAANAWDTSRDKIIAKQGILSFGDKSAGYGEFANSAVDIVLGEEPEIKNPR